MARILGRECGEAGENGTGDPAPEFGRPAGRRGGIRPDERVGNGLGRHEGMGHDAAEQIVLVAHPERLHRGGPDEGVVRHQIHRDGVAASRDELPDEFETFEGSQPHCDPLVGHSLVTVHEAALRNGVDGNDATQHWKSPIGCRACSRGATSPPSAAPGIPQPRPATRIGLGGPLSSDV